MMAGPTFRSILHLIQTPEQALGALGSITIFHFSDACFLVEGSSFSWLVSTRLPAALQYMKLQQKWPHAGTVCSAATSSWWKPKKSASGCIGAKPDRRPPHGPTIPGEPLCLTIHHKCLTIHHKYNNTQWSFSLFIMGRPGLLCRVHSMPKGILVSLFLRFCLHSPHSSPEALGRIVTYHTNIPCYCKAKF